MAIDSIGGPPRDPTYESRRRQVEEQRAREIEKIETKNKQSVEELQTAREKALHSVYENQTAEIDQRQRESDERITAAKAAAEARVREFEGESTKLTEEAKRQFQAKADTLNKSARELDQQRNHLLKTHTDNISRIKNEQDQKLMETHSKFSREASDAYVRGQFDLKNVEERGQEQIEQVQQTIQDRKRMEQTAGAKEIERLKMQRDENSNTIQSQIHFNEASAADQLNHVRENMEQSRTAQQMRYDAAMSDLNRQNQGILSRGHIQGERKVKEAADVYTNQLEGMRKDGRQKMRDLQDRSSMTLSTLESQAKAQEEIAQAGFVTKKQIIQGRREKTIAEAEEQNTALHHRVAENYAKQSKALTDERNHLLDTQQADIQAEIKFQKVHSQAKLNEATERDAMRLSDHETKAEDPFYRVHEMSAEVNDLGPEILVHVNVAEHEQDKVRLTLQQNSLAVSGSRRYEDRVTTPEGHKATTNSYQSYSETFPITGKLLMNKMMRSYADGRLTFRIPRG